MRSFATFWTRFAAVLVATLASGCVRAPAPQFDGLERLDATHQPLFGASASVFVFVRSDCPISNRYAPLLERLGREFESLEVAYHLVYVDPDETPERIAHHRQEYGLTIDALRDPKHALVRAVGATVTPEAAVFDAGYFLVYRGRIDDLYVDLGKSRAQAQQHDLLEAVRQTVAGKTIATPRREAIGCKIEDLRS